MEVATFSSFYVTARYGVPNSTDWSFGSEGEEFRICAHSCGHLVVLLIATRQAFEQIWLFRIFNGSIFGKVLGYVTFERAGEIGLHAENSIRWFQRDWDIASVYAVLVYNREAK